MEEAEEEEEEEGVIKGELGLSMEGVGCCGVVEEWMELQPVQESETRTRESPAQAQPGTGTDKRTDASAPFLSATRYGRYVRLQIWKKCKFCCAAVYCVWTGGCG